MYKFTILLLSCLSFLHCRKEIEERFEMQYDTTFTIPPGLDPFSAHYFDIQAVPTNIDNYMAANNTTLTEVGALRPKSFRLASVFGDTEFDFIQRITVFLYNEAEPTVLKEVAYLENVPRNIGNVLDLQPSLVDAKPMLSRPYTNVRIRVELRNSPPSLIENRFTLKFYAEK